MIALIIRLVRKVRTPCRYEHIIVSANENWEGVIFRRKGQQKVIPPKQLGKGEMVV